MRKIFCILTVLLAFASVKAQNINIYNSNWRSETSLYNAKGAIIDSKGRLWSVSEGGACYTGLDSNDVHYLRNTSGLLTSNLTAIGYNAIRKEILLGAMDGTIEIINEEDLSIVHILDIKSSSMTNPTIKAFAIDSEKVYVATAFGICLLDEENRVFKESITKLGSYSQYSSITDLLSFDGQLWALTDYGLAKLKDKSKFMTPSAWENYYYKKGFDTNDVQLKGATVFNDSIYFYTSHSIYQFQSDSLIRLRSRTASEENITGIFPLNGALYYSHTWALYKFTKSAIITSDAIDPLNYINYSANTTYHRITKAFSYDGTLIVTRDGAETGIIDSHLTYSDIKLNCPLSNLIQDLYLDSNQTLWTAVAAGAKFNSFNDGLWTSYSNNTYNIKNIIYGCSPSRIFKSSSNDVYASYQGSGLGVLKNGADSIQVYNEDNSPLTGYDANHTWVMPGEVKEDKSGTIWIINLAGIFAGPSLIALDKNNVFHPFYNQIFRDDRALNPLVIDNNGVKWLGSTGGNQYGGLYAYSENVTLSDSTDDIWFRITSSNSSLGDNSVNDLALDKDGYLMIATSHGAYVLINPSCALTKSSPIVRKIKVVQDDIAISVVAVDALNQKWLGTPSTGLWVLNADGTEVVAQFTTSNSLILSNEIKSIEFNNKTGDVYVGTTKGLSIFNSLSITPKGDYDIKCYPQPFNPDKDGYLFIEGFAENANIKITTIDGVEVNTIETVSNKVVWDGRDKNGSLVPNGVYLILGDSQEAGKNGLAKVAVLRK